MSADGWTAVRVDQATKYLRNLEMYVNIITVSIVYSHYIALKTICMIK